MNNFTDKQPVRNTGVRGTAIPGAGESAADSQALQELIDILKEPFQTTCEHCDGEGVLKSGKLCDTCKGKGKILERILR